MSARICAAFCSHTHKRLWVTSVYPVSVTCPECFPGPPPVTGTGSSTRFNSENEWKLTENVWISWERPWKLQNVLVLIFFHKCKTIHCDAHQGSMSSLKKLQSKLRKSRHSGILASNINQASKLTAAVPHVGGHVELLRCPSAFPARLKSLTPSSRLPLKSAFSLHLHPSFPPLSLNSSFSAFPSQRLAAPLLTAH